MADLKINVDENGLSVTEKKDYTPFMYYGLAGAIIGLMIMFYMTDKRGFMWGAGFWILGAIAGNTVGYIGEKVLK